MTAPHPRGSAEGPAASRGDAPDDAAPTAPAAPTLSAPPPTLSAPPPTLRAPPPRCALHTRARRGEGVSGDACFALEVQGAWRFVVVDALGHGAAAHAVAERCATLMAAPASSPAALLALLHEGLRGTRGAAASVVFVDDTALHAAGVGNVEVRSAGIKLAVALTPGILGAGGRFKPVEFTAPRQRGARVALFSDGVSSRLDLHKVAGLDVAAAAAQLFHNHAYDHDDASLLLLQLE